MKTDWHVHTIYSEDSTSTPCSMIKSAFNKGFDAIGIAEHYDMNPNDNGYGYFNLSSWLHAMNAVKDEFSDKITIYSGLEFGEPHLYPEEFNKIASSVDYIIGSIHWCDDLFMAQSELIKRYGIDGMYNAYFAQVLSMVEFGGFDILGHFDFPIRYHRIQYDINNPLIEKILSEIIKKDIALEINTSNLRLNLPDTMPSALIISIFNDMGGRLVSFGSDAHTESHVGSNYDTFIALQDKFPKLELFNL